MLNTSISEKFDKYYDALTDSEKEKVEEVLWVLIHDYSNIIRNSFKRLEKNSMMFEEGFTTYDGDKMEAAIQDNKKVKELIEKMSLAKYIELSFGL